MRWTTGLRLCCAVLCLMGTGAAGSIVCGAGESPEYVEHVELSNVELSCQAHLNGVYRENAQIIDERPTYTKPGTAGSANRHIYHLNGEWLLSPVMGSTAIDAFKQSDSLTVPVDLWSVSCDTIFQGSAMIFCLYDNFGACEQCSAGKFKGMPLV